jgi:DNA replication protein DnaC
VKERLRTDLESLRADIEGPHLQVISERHERGSLIVTSNLPFGEWGKVFPDPRLAKAVVDRLTHRAHIIETGTESWRFRHRLAQAPRARSRGRARGAPGGPDSGVQSP